MCATAPATTPIWYTHSLSLSLSVTHTRHMSTLRRMSREGWKRLCWHVRLGARHYTYLVLFPLSLSLSIYLSLSLSLSPSYTQKHSYTHTHAHTQTHAHTRHMSTLRRMSKEGWNTLCWHVRHGARRYTYLVRHSREKPRDPHLKLMYRCMGVEIEPPPVIQLLLVSGNLGFSAFEEIYRLLSDFIELLIEGWNTLYRYVRHGARHYTYLAKHSRKKP